MKKTIRLLLGAVLMMSILPGCSAQGGNDESRNNSLRSPAASASNNAAPGSRVLIVYYSLSGTTENVAKLIQRKTGGDIYLLEPDPAYPRAQEAAGTEMAAERSTNSIRGLKGTLPNLSAYDYILIGGPVWSGEPSNPVQKYLSLADFGGRKVSGFWTAYGDPAHYADEFKALVRNGNILDGLSLINADVSNNTTLNSKIDAWLKVLGIF